MHMIKFLSALPLLMVAQPAIATEIFGGIYIHDVDTPLTKSGIEKGGDFQLGWRGDGLFMTPLQPYAFVAVNSSGETNYAAIGLSAKFGDALYVRPGLGLALHTGSASNFDRRDKIAFGSRVLFEPELALGVRVAPRITAEASWIHMSHAQLFGRQNPGIDNIGVRVNLGL